MPGEYGMECGNVNDGFEVGSTPQPPADAGCRLAVYLAGDLNFYCCSCAL
jgi:hypothetical protein